LNGTACLDDIFEVFYIEEGEATFCSMTAEPKTVKLIGSKK